MPKGGDLHYHLSGGVYAEDLLNWAAEDDLCIDTERFAILADMSEAACATEESLRPAGEVLRDATLARRLINAVSMRDFVPETDWALHDQFFSTFYRMAHTPKRLGESLASVVRRAAMQNVSYLEVMDPYALDFVEWAEETTDAATPQAMYAEMEAAGLAERLAATQDRLSRTIDAAVDRKNALLACGSEEAEPGCGVEVRFLYLALRTRPPAGTFAGFILGYAMAESSPHFVGLNLAGPEDAPVALNDYELHMAMLDFLWQKEGPRSIALHAGELKLGLVPPRHMRDHIRKAIDIGHARRIGHGVSIAHEAEVFDLLRRMREAEIAVETNLTSNATLIEYPLAEHPFTLYRDFGVPTVLSTDDEGVFRTDLTNEYQKAVTLFELEYADLKRLSFDSIRYGFLAADERRDLTASLERRFRDFEAAVATWPHKAQSGRP